MNLNMNLNLNLNMNFLMWCMLPPLIFSILLAFVKPFFSQSFFVRLKFAIN